MSAPLLFRPYVCGDMTLRNRVVISPMCQYAADSEGHATDWHLVHLGSRAAGGAGLVMVEATCVERDGRMSIGDLGLWDDSQIAPLARVVEFVKSQGAACGMQLVHAGRRAASDTYGEDALRLVGPSAVAAGPGWRTPEALSAAGIDSIVSSFRDAAGRAARAGFDVIELHAAHGYLLHSFLSPLANLRTDEYGGDVARRAALLVRVAAAVREIWPRPHPLWVRLSCEDGAEGGATISDSVEVARLLRPLVDVIDCSSGGIIGETRLPTRAREHLSFARRIRSEAELPTCAVGRLRRALQCERALARGDADLIAIGRASLNDPLWPVRAAKRLGYALPYHPKSYRTRELFVRTRDELGGGIVRWLSSRLT
jgi:2,4-dienoyl-CoA reductase-like NADH-dependent reductase (Old Yellow Enzyme family)